VFFCIAKKQIKYHWGRWMGTWPREPYEAAGRPAPPRLWPLARSTAKGVPRVGDGARWASGGPFALCRRGGGRVRGLRLFCP